jgi:hypothetical protein
MATKIQQIRRHCRELSGATTLRNIQSTRSFQSYDSLGTSIARIPVDRSSVILKRANSPPRITARRGGGVTKKMARSLLIDAAGVVFLVRSIGTPPCPRKKRMLRSIFLIARPPLLAVMRGGEFALLKNGA